MYCNSDKFQTLFNKNVKINDVKKEPDIVKSLHKTIQDLKNKGCKIDSSFVHQKYCTYFDKNLSQQPIKRELADLLLVIRREREIRYSFVQFKNRSDAKKI